MVTIMTRAGQGAVAPHHHIITEGLQHSDSHRGVAGDGLDLLPAFLAAVLRQPLQVGDSHRQQLDDDGTVDIRLHAQGKHRGSCESAAAHDVVQAQDGGAHGIQLAPQGVYVNVGNRNGVANPEDQQNQNRENQLFPQFGNSPRLTNRLDHLTSPQPFRQPLR